MNEILNELQKLNDRMSNLEENSLLNAKDVLTMQDVAKLTGLSMAYLYNMTSKRKIPHYKCGGKITYFKKSEINDWLLKYRVNTQEDIESEAAMRLHKNRNKN